MILYLYLDNGDMRVMNDRIFILTYMFMFIPAEPICKDFYDAPKCFLSAPSIQVWHSSDMVTPCPAASCLKRRWVLSGSCTTRRRSRSSGAVGAAGLLGAVPCTPA